MGVSPRGPRRTGTRDDDDDTMFSRRNNTSTSRVRMDTIGVIRFLFRLFEEILGQLGFMNRIMRTRALRCVILMFTISTPEFIARLSIQGRGAGIFNLSLALAFTFALAFTLAL